MMLGFEGMDLFIMTKTFCWLGHCYEEEEEFISLNKARCLTGSGAHKGAFLARAKGRSVPFAEIEFEGDVYVVGEAYINTREIVACIPWVHGLEFPKEFLEG